jgi:2-C-methyl-D-erythritol 4-phosphate cytidylyltransferase
MENVIKLGNGTTAVKTIDTICQVDETNRIVNIPSREKLWSIQTPQCFKYEDIREAQELLLKREPSMSEGQKRAITDDVGVVQRFLDKEVFVFLGSYDNIKVTNPEDIASAEGIISNIE